MLSSLYMGISTIMGKYTIGFSAMAGLAAFIFMGQEQAGEVRHISNHASPVMESSAIADLKEKETWDAYYLLGCHSKHSAKDLLFCYQTVSGKTILGYFEAFRHGNTLLKKYEDSQDMNFLFASGYVTQAGMRNFKSLQDTCLSEESGCPEDLKEKISKDRSVASDLGRRYANVVQHAAQKK